MMFLHLLGLRKRQTQTVRDILTDMIPTDCDDHRMPHIPIDVYRQVSCATADITDGNTHLTFMIGQHYFSRSKRVQYKLLNLNACCPHTLTQVIHRCGSSSDDLRFDFKAIAMPASRIADAILSVNRKATLDHMNDFTIVRDCNRACLL